MKLLVDMNLSPSWATFFQKSGIEAVHWSAVGSFDAPDSEILAFAHIERYTILTQDLDFGAMLATTQQQTASVIQLRTDDVSLASVGSLVLRAVRQMQSELEQGALLSVDPGRLRLRLLPLRSRIQPVQEE